MEIKIDYYLKSETQAIQIMHTTVTETDIMEEMTREFKKGEIVQLDADMANSGTVEVVRQTPLRKFTTVTDGRAQWDVMTYRLSPLPTEKSNEPTTTNDPELIKQGVPELTPAESTNEVKAVENWKHQLELEVQHIFDSGANEIRIINMVEMFINRRFTSLPLEPLEACSGDVEQSEYSQNAGDNFFYDKLKPCPFCNSEPQMLFIGNDFTKSRKIEIKCANVDCRCNMVNAALRDSHETLAKHSIDCWNKRPDFATSHQSKSLNKSELHELALKCTGIDDFDSANYTHKMEVIAFKKGYYFAHKSLNEAVELSEAVKELLQVKEWKDKYGKDEQYLKAQPIAWANLKTAYDAFLSQFKQ